jgi:hypothetical protein
MSKAFENKDVPDNWEDLSDSEEEEKVVEKEVPQNKIEVLADYAKRLLVMPLSCYCALHGLNKEDFPTNKLILPPTILKFIFEENSNIQFPSPLIFCIQNQNSDKKLYAGVQDFDDRANGLVIIPDNMMAILGIKAKDQTKVKLSVVDIPVGKHIKVKPLEREFMRFTIDRNPKSLLNEHLNDQFVVSKDDLLVIRKNGMVFHVEVIECYPSDTIKIYQTDITLGIETEHLRKVLRYDYSLKKGEIPIYDENDDFQDSVNSSTKEDAENTTSKSTKNQNNTVSESTSSTARPINREEMRNHWIKRFEK